MIKVSLSAITVCPVLSCRFSHSSYLFPISINQLKLQYQRELKLSNEYSVPLLCKR